MTENHNVSTTQKSFSKTDTNKQPRKEPLSGNISEQKTTNACEEMSDRLKEVI